MQLQEIPVEKLPKEVGYQLMSSEKVYYFTFIVFEENAGCLSSKKKPVAHYWLAMTDKRVIYKTKVASKEDKTEILKEREGDLPFNKIGFIEVFEKTEKKTDGCNSKSSSIVNIEIGTSGGTIVIPIQTKEKGHQIRKVFSELSNQ